MVLSPRYQVSDAELEGFVQKKHRAYVKEQSLPAWITRALEAPEEPPRLGGTMPPPHKPQPVIGRHHRCDTVPCSHTWRRCVGSVDAKVCIYLHFPCSGDDIRLRIHPELRLGPCESAPAGHALAERASPSRARRPQSARSTVSASDAGTTTSKTSKDASSVRCLRLRAKLFAKKQGRQPTFSDLSKVQQQGARDTLVPDWFTLDADEDSPPTEEDSLKEQIQRLIGVIPSEQKIFFNKCHLADNHSTLADYGIGHGDTLLVMARDARGHNSQSKTQKYNPADLVDVRNKASKNCPGRPFRFMPRWQTHPAPRLLSAEASEVTSMASDGLYVHHFLHLPDRGHRDCCGQIRKAHGILA